ncbi:MAG: alcohol dehydrogenase catalytic domain-containing protein [Chloroflexi bacterium]|nr:alcohol dehydrogenase catalytic domain-containing protein [Chloroflexota bacterium]
MKQAVTVAPRSIEIHDAPETEQLADGQALLAIVAVGLCGSDLEMYKGTDPISRFPCRQGHEFSGRILALHDGYDGEVRVRDLVAVEPLLPCGSCIACRRGHPNCCVNLRVAGGQIDGALIERFIMPVRNLYRADDLTPEAAAFAEPVSIGLQMVNRSGVVAGDRAVVLGAGPIGQAVILAGRDRGARLLAVDRIAQRLELARATGAEMTVDAAREDVAAMVGAWTDGEGPVVVYEATGATAVMRQAIELAAHSGTVVIAGTPTDELSFPAMWLVRKELNILGSRNNAGVYGEAVRIVRENQAAVHRIVTHRYPLHQVQDAMEFAIANPAKTGKVMITIGQ